jgi:hypothetical protein
VANRWMSSPGHGVPDDCERLQADLVLSDKIIGAVDLTLIDLRLWDEMIDVDCVSALNGGVRPIFRAASGRGSFGP